MPLFQPLQRPLMPSLAQPVRMGTCTILFMMLVAALVGPSTAQAAFTGTGNPLLRLNNGKLYASCQIGSSSGETWQVLKNGEVVPDPAVSGDFRWVTAAPTDMWACRRTPDGGASTDTASFTTLQLMPNELEKYRASVYFHAPSPNPDMNDRWKCKSGFSVIQGDQDYSFFGGAPTQLSLEMISVPSGARIAGADEEIHSETIMQKFGSRRAICRMKIVSQVYGEEIIDSAVERAYNDTRGLDQKDPIERNISKWPQRVTCPAIAGIEEATTQTVALFVQRDHFRMVAGKRLRAAGGRQGDWENYVIYGDRVRVLQQRFVTPGVSIPVPKQLRGKKVPGTYMQCIDIYSATEAKTADQVKAMLPAWMRTGATTKKNLPAIDAEGWIASAWSRQNKKLNLDFFNTHHLGLEYTALMETAHNCAPASYEVRQDWKYSRVASCYKQLIKQGLAAPGAKVPK